LLWRNGLAFPTFKHSVHWWRVRTSISFISPRRTRAARGRHKALDIYQKIEITWSNEDKTKVYGELLRAMMRDQVR